MQAYTITDIKNNGRVVMSANNGGMGTSQIFSLNNVNRLKVGDTIYVHRNKFGGNVAYESNNFLETPFVNLDKAYAKEIIGKFNGISFKSNTLSLDKIRFKIAIAKALIGKGIFPTMSAAANMAFLCNSR